MVSFYLSDLRSRRESKCVRFSIYLSKFADKKKGARDKTNPFQMRGGALDRAAGAARDGGAFGTATAPVARFAAFRGAGRAAAFGGGGGGGVCFLLRAVVVASAAAAFGAGLVPSSSSSVASSSSSPAVAVAVVRLLLDPRAERRCPPPDLDPAYPVPPVRLLLVGPLLVPALVEDPLLGEQRRVGPGGAGSLGDGAEGNGEALDLAGGELARAGFGVDPGGEEDLEERVLCFFFFFFLKKE